MGFWESGGGRFRSGQRAQDAPVAINEPVVLFTSGRLMRPEDISAQPTVLDLIRCASGDHTWGLLHAADAAECSGHEINTECSGKDHCRCVHCGEEETGRWMVTNSGQVLKFDAVPAWTAMSGHILPPPEEAYLAPRGSSPREG